MNLKIKLNIAGQDLELTLEEARELWLTLDKLMPPLPRMPVYLPPALSEPPSPFPRPHTPFETPYTPPHYPTVICDATPPKVLCDGGDPFRKYRAP